MDTWDSESAGASPWAPYASHLQSAKRIVVKIGTSTLTYPNGRLNLSRMESLVRQLVDVANEGREVVLVTSGAIGAGMSRLGMNHRPRSIPEKQAVAAVGQSLLMQMYEKLFGEYGYIVGQLLLTREDLTHRKRHLNCRNTIQSLWRLKAIPVVNENDTVAVDEIKFGDNDTLAALVAGLIAADLLIILSDVDGVYDENPQVNPDATLLPVIHEITPELIEAAGGPGSLYGSGGMGTKLQAAKMSMAGGTAVVIANGSRPGVIRAILDQKGPGTLFVPRGEKMAGRKRWIAFYLPAEGQVKVDQGAGQALVQGGKSLLPAGVIDVVGDFQEGDVVQVVDETGKELARGLVNYGASELRKIQGRSTHEIPVILGYKYFDEVIHRDNLVISS